MVPGRVEARVSYVSTSGTVGSISTAVQVAAVNGVGAFVVGGSTTSLRKFSANYVTTTNFTYVTSPGTPKDVAVADSSTLYLLGGTSVYKYTINSNSLTQVASQSPAGSGGANGLSIDNSGNIWTYRTTLYKYNSGLTSSTPYTISSGTSKLGGRFVVDATGSCIYYADTSTLYKATISGTNYTQSALNSLAFSPSLIAGTVKGVYVSTAGTIYVAESTSGAIYKFDSNGNMLWKLTSNTAPSSLANMVGMSVSGNGRILILNTSGQIKIFDPISSVAGLVATASSTSVTVSWNAASVPTSDFSGAVIRRSTSGYPVSVSDGSTVVSGFGLHVYTDSGLSASTRYYYTVFNQTSDGYYDKGVTVSVTTGAGGSAPVSPTVTAAKNALNGNSITVTWNVPSGTTSFSLSRSDNGGGYNDVDTNISSSTTSYTQTSLGDGTYTYKVVASNAYGNSSPGTSSSLTIDTTAPAAPSLTAVKTTQRGNSIALSWTEADSVSK